MPKYIDAIKSNNTFIVIHYMNCLNGEKATIRWKKKYRDTDKRSRIKIHSKICNWYIHELIAILSIFWSDFWCWICLHSAGLFDVNTCAGRPVTQRSFLMKWAFVPTMLKNGVESIDIGHIYMLYDVNDSFTFVDLAHCEHLHVQCVSMWLRLRFWHLIVLFCSIFVFFFTFI